MWKLMRVVKKGFYAGRAAVITVRLGTLGCILSNTYKYPSKLKLLFLWTSSTS